MRVKIAIYICPETGCAVTGRKDQKCPTHGHSLEREIFIRASTVQSAKDLREAADKLRSTADQMGGQSPLGSDWDKLMRVMKKIIGDV